MAKRRVESQIVYLTPNQKKSKIDPIYLDVEGMQHTLEKLSMRATTLLQTTSRSEVYLQSYGAPKSRNPTGAILGLPFENPKREKPFGCRLRGQPQSIL